MRGRATRSKVIAVAFGTGILMIMLATMTLDVAPMHRVVMPTTTISPSSDAVIQVAGEAELAAVADRGAGTPGDPFIIEDKVIDANNSGPGISISHTRSHVIIKNCTIINAFRMSILPFLYRIEINNCTNVSVTGNHLLPAAGEDVRSLSLADGISVLQGKYVSITGNVVKTIRCDMNDSVVTGNLVYSIQISYSYNTTIWDNSILSDCLKSYHSGNNTWDNGTHGNYWYDYQERYPNAKHNGVTWDTPYAIFENGIDCHPLVHDPFARPAVPGAPVVAIIAMLVAGVGLGIVHTVGFKREANAR